MPLVIPIGGAGTNSVEVVSSALASFETARTRISFASLGSAEVRGLQERPALGASIVRILAMYAGLGALDAGEVQLSGAGGAMDAGGAHEGSARASLEARVSTLRACLLTADVGNSGEEGATEVKAWASLVGLVVGGDATAPALVSLEAQGETRSAAYGALTQVRDAARPALASLTTSIPTSGESLSSIDAGREGASAAAGALEVEGAEGLQIIVDIVDEIIDTAKGDVC